MSDSNLLNLSEEERRKFYEDNVRKRAQQAKDKEEAEQNALRANYIAQVRTAIKSDRLAEFLWEMEQRLTRSSGEPQIKSE
ncbi:MAG: hypothetical protein HYS51_00740 [Candidatus Zambryskibacteria bacterium]|nr:hypothetical protein [Candidatus Zambryskibacteria bacterium]